MLNERQRVERALPPYLMWWCCKVMERDPDGEPEKCRAFADEFAAVARAEFVGMRPAEHNKAWGRLVRAARAADEPLMDAGVHVGHALVAVRVIVQRVWAAGCYEPPAAFLDVWGRFVDAVYDTCDNGRCLNAVEPEAERIAAGIVDRLHREKGLWRDLCRNEARAAA